MSNRQGVAYDADNLVTLTPGSLTFNGTTYDVTANGSAAAAQLTANTALAIANAALPKAGGTMTGQINMSNQKIVSLGTPTVSTDAATKGYVDTSVVGLLDLQGTIDCSTNPNYPAANKGDVWVVSVAGLIGGVAGISVQAGDALVALADNPGGTQAAVGSSWSILQANLVGALLAVNNLSDVQNVATARTNLGLGTAAQSNVGDFATAAQGALASTAVQRAGDTMTGLLTIINAAVDSLLKVTSKGIGELPIKVRSSNAKTVAGAQAGMDFGFDDTNRVTFATAANSGVGTPFDGSAYFYAQNMNNGLRFVLSNNSTIEFWPNAARALSVYSTTTRIGGASSTNAAVLAVRAYVAPATDTTTMQLGMGDSTGYSWQMGRDNTSTGDFAIQAVSNANVAYFTNALRIMWSNGNVALGRSTATAVLHLKAGTASANTSPLKFTSGTNLTTPEAGAMEYNGTLSFTDSSAARKDVALKTTYTPTLTPALIVGTGYTEQTFTVTGLATSDTVIVNGPAAAANSVLVHARVSAANTLALTWITDAANITPTSGTYRIVAIRS